MKQKITIIILIATMSGCILAQRRMEQQYYRAKQIYLIVAQAAYDYAARPETAPAVRAKIIDVEENAYRIIHEVDHGTRQVAMAREALMRAAQDLAIITHPADGGDTK